MKYDDEDLHLTLPDVTGSSFLETLDAIRDLRAQADAESARNNYDPTGFTERRVKAIRAHADGIEATMERRLGWRTDDGKPAMVETTTMETKGPHHRHLTPQERATLAKIFEDCGPSEPLRVWAALVATQLDPSETTTEDARRGILRAASDLDPRAKSTGPRPPQSTPGRRKPKS